MLSGMSVRRSEQAGGPSVIVAPTKTIQMNEIGGIAFAFVGVDSDGDMYETQSGSAGVPDLFYETWLDAGLNTQVWVEAILTSGDALNGGSNTTGTTRHALTTDKKWGYEAEEVDLSGVVTLRFYDALTGGNLLDTQAVTLEANTL
jgi:hypothetical protein